MHVLLFVLLFVLLLYSLLSTQLHTFLLRAFNKYSLHLTVESYTVIYAANSHTYYY